MRSKVVRLTVLFLMVSAMFAAADTGTAVELYRAGADAQFREDYYRAIELYRQSLDTNPAFVDAMKGLAECYFYLNEYTSSLEWIEQAHQYRRNNPELMNLEARILLGTGNIHKAAERFEEVLQMEPNNLSALFGRAELDIVSGRVQSAARTYEDALRISPENKKALLSLILVYDSLGETDKAEYFARRSLDLHSDSALAHFITAGHFFRVGSIEDAEFHVKTALQIDPDNYQAMLLLSDIYLYTGRHREVLDLGKKLLEQDRKESMTWYILGIAAWKLEMFDEAWYYLNEAVHLQPDDDIARLAMEQLLMENFELDNPHRKDAAAYHFQLGRGFIDKNLITDALREFRRGLMLDPYSEEGRLLYGRVFRDTGKTAKYVSVLEVLIHEGAESREIKDDYEIYSSLLSGRSVAESWNFDQFSHQRDMYTLSIFYITERQSSDHPGSGAILSRYFRNAVFAFEPIQPLAEEGVDGFADAYRRARDTESEYFIILKTREIERIISLVLEMYNSRTGTRVLTEDILRTGNGRVPGAFTKAARRVNEFLIPRGRLVERSFNTALIDLGSADGIKEGDTLDIIRRGSLELSSDDAGFDYADADLLGHLTVTDIDYLISEGTVSRKAFFDMINQYDHVIPQRDDEVKQGPKETALPVDLYRMLLRIP